MVKKSKLNKTLTLSKSTKNKLLSRKLRSGTTDHPSVVFFLSLATRIDADFDEEEDVDIEGYDDDESTSQSYTKKESFGSQQLLGSEQDSQEMSQFESILLDLQHSESESEEDDFPFGDGDDEDEEDIEEEEQISFSPGGDESNEAIKEELTEDL